MHARRNRIRVPVIPLPEHGGRFDVRFRAFSYIVKRHGIERSTGDCRRKKWSDVDDRTKVYSVRAIPMQASLLTSNVHPIIPGEDADGPSPPAEHLSACRDVVVQAKSVV